MALWELDEFSTAQFLGFIRNLPEPQSYLGAGWLPNLPVFDLEFEYIMGATNRPVMAHVMGFDAEAPIGGRPGRGETVRGELPPIKRKLRIGEKTLIRFLNPRMGTPDQQLAVDQVFEDASDLVASIQARVEWLRMQALSADTVIYDESGVKFEFDFGLNDTQQITLGAAGATDGAGDDVSDEFSVNWTDPEAEMLNDIVALTDRVADNTGRRPAEYVVTREVPRLMSKNAHAKAMYFGVGNEPDRPMTPSEVGNLLSQWNAPSLTVYDVVLDKEEDDGSVSQVRPLAPGSTFMLPPGFSTQNRTLWGPTAESRILLGTPLATSAPGVWANTYATDEPPAEWVKAAAVAFPTMPEAHLIGQMKVF